MDDSGFNDVIRRLDAIEARLARLEAVPPARPLPPVIDVPPPVNPQWTWGQASPPNPVDTEYFVGAKILPRAGAGVLTLMFAYFVSIAYDRGWIGPSTIFGGAVALCLLLIGLGQWKRNEREQFGEILTGIGSCGLFLSFAGGHVFQKLYSGETMLALFVGLSLVNLAYSLWRSSKAFLAIGVAGGFIAALMPLDQHRPELSLALYTLILVPAALVVAKNRWTDAAVVLWVVAAVTTLPIGQEARSDWRIGVAALEVTGLIALATYAVAARKGEGSAPSVAAGILTFLTGFSAFQMQDGSAGGLHVCLFSAAALLIALLAKGQTRSTLAVSAIGTAFTIAPFGLLPVATMFTFLGLAGVAAAASVRWSKIECLLLAGLEIVLALVRYTDFSSSRAMDLRVDLLFLGSGVVVASLAGVLARRENKDAEAAFLFAALVFLMRAAYLSVIAAGWLTSSFALTAAMIVGSVAALALGFWRSHPSLRHLSFAGFAITSAKALTLDLATAAPFVRVALLFCLGVGLLAGGYWYVRRGQGEGC